MDRKIKDLGVLKVCRMTKSVMKRSDRYHFTVKVNYMHKFV